jgi:hypothetical protein
MKTALTFAVAVALALALFVRALVYAVVDAVHLLDLFGNLASV